MTCMSSLPSCYVHHILDSKKNKLDVLCSVYEIARCNQQVMSGLICSIDVSCFIYCRYKK